DNLGGMAGHVVDFPVATGTMAVRSVPAVYTSTTGLHMTFSAATGSTCMGALSGMGAIMSVQIAAGSPPAPKVVWCAAHTGTDTAPIVTTSDGTNDPIVWYINSGKLTAVDGDSGMMLYTSSDTCSAVRQWTSPIAVKGRIVVAGDKHLCSWSPH
ncbi:MAG TPA: hypothetical protein VHZ95_22795, partial [Polyangiales bacterium]|nr:hypothetical protein [Polyangiales bacterium]